MMGVKMQNHTSKYFQKNLLTLLIVIGSFVLAPFAYAQDYQVSSNEKNLKFKVAIGRFSNETNYGKSLLRDNDLDPLGKQAADILTAYLAMSDKFLIFERPDLSKIEREQGLSGDTGIVGVDTLIIGSVVEFGRAADGQRGLFNRKKVQTAHAKVAVRFVDVRTGLVFHSATGTGDATNETKTVLGVGSTAGFDATLNDKAISVAIEDMIEELVNTLSGRTWKTDILAVEGSNVYISGGEKQGLKVGDRLAVMKEGKTVKSNQTGFNITLPASKVGELQVISLFGDNETNEGAVTNVVSGEIGDGRPEGLFVTTVN
ncbi:MAG: curli production assembly protein CsgG [Kordiimonadaceae bacterium]|nr:curli production assembly protein CsgG [Kordiimonadaceae bacterium]